MHARSIIDSWAIILDTGVLDNCVAFYAASEGHSMHCETTAHLRLNVVRQYRNKSNPGGINGLYIEQT